MCVLSELGKTKSASTIEEMRLFWNERGHEIDDMGCPVAKATVFKMEDLLEAKKNLFAHIMVEIGVFNSVSSAKKNGWDKPIEKGDFEVTKKKIKFSIV